MDETLAPEFPPTLDWLNVSAPLRMEQLRGKVCALAFVNAGSAWSLQRLSDLAKLRARYGERLNVVAVHVPKFKYERDVRRAGKGFNQLKLDFPIAHDADWTLWQHYGIEAWPTVVLIDGEGKVREHIVGDTPVRDLDAQISALQDEVIPKSRNLEPITLRRSDEPVLPLRFPAGLAFGGSYLYVADSGHDRILECDPGGRVVRQFGSGYSGLIDGPMELAAFNRPQGLCVQRDMLYVADSGNHAVRRIQLRTGDVETLCGAGWPGQPVEGVVKDPRAIALDQPSAVAATSSTLYIATRGDNRIWKYELSSASLSLLAGSGAMEVVDGTGAEASFAEPVSITCVQQVVYVCDSAGSSIRSINARSGKVTTLLGRGLWEFGQVDGQRTDALLQHPRAIALDPDSPTLWIADSGNDTLRSLRLGGGALANFELQHRLHAPAALVVADGMAWVADTHAHAVLRVDLHTGALHHVPIGE